MSYGRKNDFGTIIQIGDILVSEEVVTEFFACDYPVCKGICCVIGDSGAPLEEEELDEQLEARIVRLEMALQQVEATLQKAESALQQQEARIARLEAENNLRKNEKLMARQAKQKKKPESPANIGELQIL